MIHLLESIDLQKIINSGLAIVIVSSLFYSLLFLKKKKKKVKALELDESEKFYHL
jgi:hypothetical protein